VDSENCINATSSRLCEHLGLEVVPHLHPFKVSCIYSATLEVKQRCLVPINCNHYKDNIWCDVITMNVGKVILDRQWLFNKNVTINGRSNMRQFEHKGKQIKLLLLRLKTGQPKQTFTLALLPTPPLPSLIATVPSLSFTTHAYHVRKPLPPLLPTPSRYSACESAFASHKHCTNYTKKSVMEINRAM